MKKFRSRLSIYRGPLHENRVLKMADTICFTSVFGAMCIFIIIWDFGINASDLSLSLGTCDSEEREDAFCESQDKNKYLKNIDVSGEAFHEARLEETEAIKISPENMAKVEISSIGINESLSEIRDQQVHVNETYVNQWLGLQIPVVDGVKVRLYKNLETISPIRARLSLMYFTLFR